MSNTPIPPQAAIGSLSFALNNTSVGVDATTINQVITETLLPQPDGSLSMYANVKLAQEGVINGQTEFVNVIVYSKIKGFPVQFESRKTDNELNNLLNMSSSDPLNDQVYRNSITQKVTHIRFRFDKVLLPLDATPNDPNPGLPNETIGINGYEQNNGTVTIGEKGKNYSIGYQNTQLQGVSFTVGANPGKPTINFIGTASIQPSTVGGASYLSVSANLRITLPVRTGGAKLRTYNAYMTVDSANNHQVVAQVLNQPSGGVIADDAAFVDVTLFYDSLVDGDVVSFSASVDNVNFKESPLSDLVSVTASLRAATPVIQSYRSAEILIPTATNGYNNADIPGVRFTFSAELTGNAGSWKFVSLFARLTGVGDTFRLAQQWSRGTQVGTSPNNVSDIDSQITTSGVCERVWNQKTVGTYATWLTNGTNGADSLGGSPLPCYTAFDIYIVLSENANIGNLGGSILGQGTASTVGIKIGTPTQSQSRDSVITKVITSIYRPTFQIVNTTSNISLTDATLLTLSNTFTGEFNMPQSHVTKYYANDGLIALNNYTTLKAVDISNSNSVVYDGELTPNSSNFRLTGNTFNAVSNPSAFTNLSSTTTPLAQWKSNYAFSLTNSLMVQVTGDIEQVLALTPTQFNYTQPSQIVTIQNSKYLVYYKFSSLELVRTKPVADTVLPNVFIKNVGESRLFSGGSGNLSSFGATQLLVELDAALAYNTGPYKWSELEIQVTTSNFEGISNTSTTKLTSPAALLSEILYLPNTINNSTISPGVDFGNAVISPMNGAGAVNVGFSSWLPGAILKLRLRLKYTWNGANSLNGVSSADNIYVGPYYGASLLLDTPKQYTVSPTPPPPILSTVSVSRTRALKLSVSTTIPQPNIQLTPGGSNSNQLNLHSITFNLVDAFNNQVVFPAGFPSSIVYPYINAPLGNPVNAFFNFPSASSILDKFYSVVATAQYKDSTGAIVNSPPLRSNEIFFEKIANITFMQVVETQNTIKCIAQLDLGENDNVTVNNNANNTNASISNSLTGGLYAPGSMLLTCIVPAMETNSTTQEKYAHHMTWNASLVFPNGLTGGYETLLLNKVSNSDMYGPKSSFLVVTNNNTGLAIGQFPKPASANSSSYNIISTFN